MSTVNEKMKQAFDAFGAGRLDEADQICLELLRQIPKHHGALHMRGLIAGKLGRPGEAVELMRRSIALAPQIGDFYNNLGEALREIGKQEEARAAYLKAIELAPHSPEAYSNLGNLQRAEGRFDEAIASYQKAIAITPTLAVAHHNLGEVFQAMGRAEEAVVAYQTAIERRPDYVKPMVGLGVALMAQRKPREAIEWYRRAIALEPKSAEAHWNLSLALLLTGEWEEGWKEYEWRWLTKELERRDFGRPMWNGEDLRGKTILVYAEQGFGDAIQFVRYAALLNDRGARVILESPSELTRLMKSVPGIDVVVTRGESFPTFDFHVPLLSLPLPFGTTPATVPAAIPYISASPADVERFGALVAGEGLKVGLVWAGRKEHANDRNRSIRPELFRQWSAMQKVKWFSLQKGREQENPTPIGFPIVDLGPEITDFSDTAAAIANLDLLISVDTAVAHLAGAMGKRVWVLLPYAPDFRWMLDRENSPWYPTMRLFRQKRAGDWEDVMERVKASLAELEL